MKVTSSPIEHEPNQRGTVCEKLGRHNMFCVDPDMNLRAGVWHDMVSWESNSN